MKLIVSDFNELDALIKDLDKVCEEYQNTIN